MTLGWGILATGSIAKSFAKDLEQSETGKLIAVGSRMQEGADAFCAAHGGTPYGSYQAVLDDPKVEAVYIASPHHMHAEWTIKAANAGKHILCEKPFTLNVLEAEEAMQVVRDQGVHFMEAFMYRCHPQTELIKALLAAGRIGEPKMVTAEFGFSAPRDWQNFRTVNALGGGALMDVGCYCVSFARMIAGVAPNRCEYAPTISPGGYDESAVGILHFPNGMSAHFGTAIHLTLRNGATIHGTEGSLHVMAPWLCDMGMQIFKPWQSEPEEVFAPMGDKPLYAYEADAFARALGGLIPLPMPRQETIDNMHTLDALRESAGMLFGDEKPTKRKPKG
jgi:predicted dehydrogenase